MNTNYLPRISDKKLKLLLRAKGAVLIEGPKWCGKTSSAEMAAKSVLYMQDPDTSKANILTAQTKPSLLLEGETPRLLDEWQVAPELWNAVRFAVDKRRLNGQFILTGSVIPNRTIDMHTGTGRIARMKMRPMSLYETNESTGEISLEALFDGGTDLEGTSKISIGQLAFLINRGGWPAVAGETNEKIALTVAADYLEAVANEDISKADGIEKNPDRVKALLRSLSRNISNEAKTATIMNDLIANDEALSQVTIDQYINALKKIFVIEDLPAWSAKLRSKTAVRTTAKRHFTDPSIATAALRATPKRLLSDFETFGFLFESLCIRDLRIYAESIDGNVYHYRDKSGLEIDAIVQLADGRWGAVEIKMGAGQIEDAFKNLLKLKQIVDTKKMNEPSFLMVLTGTEYALQMKNGIWIVPIGCLKD
ncbi:ATPase AAA [Clostridia bacterium]|nr:ATPase AAA [Clostridia bacterium]